MIDNPNPANIALADLEISIFHIVVKLLIFLIMTYFKYALRFILQQNVIQKNINDSFQRKQLSAHFRSDTNRSSAAASQPLTRKLHFATGIYPCDTKRAMRDQASLTGLRQSRWDMRRQCHKGTLLTQSTALPIKMCKANKFCFLSGTKFFCTLCYVLQKNASSYYYQHNIDIIKKICICLHIYGSLCQHIPLYAFICQEFILQCQLKVTVGDIHSIFTTIKELYELHFSLRKINKHKKKGQKTFHPS